MPKRVDLRTELAVGRSALDGGRVRAVTDWIARLPRRAPRLIELLWDHDAGVASRAADVLERVMHTPSPALRRVVAGYKEELIGLLSEAQPPKVRWNLALTIPRMELTAAECRRVAAVLQTWLEDCGATGNGSRANGSRTSGSRTNGSRTNGSIVRTAALHGIAELSRQDPAGLPVALDLLRLAERSGTPAMRARSRILLKQLEKPGRTRRAHRGLHLFG